MNQQRVWTRKDLPETLLRAIDLAVSLRARVPIVLRVTEISGYTDWVLLLSGRSERNVRAISDAIYDGLTKQGTKAIGHDGMESGVWSLLDYDDFIVHIFYHPVRSFYDLESMWSDAPSIELDLPDEVMNAEELSQLEAPSIMPPFRGDLGLFGGYADEFDDDDDDALNDEYSEAYQSRSQSDDESSADLRDSNSLDDLIGSETTRSKNPGDEIPKTDSSDGSDSASTPRNLKSKSESEDEDDDLFEP